MKVKRIKSIKVMQLNETKRKLVRQSKVNFKDFALKIKSGVSLCIHSLNHDSFIWMLVLRILSEIFVVK